MLTSITSFSQVLFPQFSSTVHLALPLSSKVKLATMPQLATSEELLTAFGSLVSQFSSKALAYNQLILEEQIEVPTNWDRATLKQIKDETNIMVGHLSEFGFEECSKFKEEVKQSIGEKSLYVGDDDMLKTIGYISKQLAKTINDALNAIEALLFLKLQICRNSVCAQYSPSPFVHNTFKQMYLSELKRLESVVVDWALELQIENRML